MIDVSTVVLIVIVILALMIVVKAIAIVPQQHAWVVERLGKFDRVLSPGAGFVIPFIERVSYKHSLKEIPLDVPSQVCITRDNTQLQVDGVLYFQVTDPMRASYGSSNYISAITQLAQTTLRSVIGKLELDRTFEEREFINSTIVASLDEAALNWGVKVLRYEIKDLTPPNEILRAMQAQITAEREKRALIAASEGRRQEQINTPPASARPPSRAPKARSRRRSTRPRARPRPCWPSPRRPPRRSSRWARPCASPAAWKPSTSRSPNATWMPSATWPRRVIRSSCRPTCPMWAGSSPRP